MLSINTNMVSIYAQKNLTHTQRDTRGSLTKLSSGYRINKASDDVAGLVISEKMRSQIRGLRQANRNAQDGISLIQTAEGALNETHSILQRMRELTNQAVNSTNTFDDRKVIQEEVSQLKKELNRIGDTTEFNSQKLLDGTKAGPGETKGVDGSNTETPTVTGRVIADQTAGKVSDIIGSALISNFVKETVRIDGVNIDIHWEDLNTEERTILLAPMTSVVAQNKVADLLQTKINEAIDISGSNVAHVKVYVTEGLTPFITDNILTVESGTKGYSSEVVPLPGLIAEMTGDTTYGGRSTYNGSDLGPVDIDMQIDGVLISVPTPAVVKGTTAMINLSVILQSNINFAITTANTARGRTQGQDGFIEDVIVKVTDAGSLQVTSNSKTIKFADRVGCTGAFELGLTSDQQIGTEVSRAIKTSGAGIELQVGANEGHTLAFSISDMRSSALGLDEVDVSTQSNASSALTSIDSAIKFVSSERSRLGAYQNRLEHIVTNLGVMSTNLLLAESAIRDVDMAQETSLFMKKNILSQMGLSVLAQANQAPQIILKLLS